MNLSNLRTVLESGHVKRSHTCPSDAQQTCGHHAWGVAVITQYLDPDCSKAALLAALYHDAPEVLTGDIPAPAKWRWPKLAEELTNIELTIEAELDTFIDLSGEEIELVKLADSIDLLLFARHRQFMGDRYYEIFETRLLAHLMKKAAVVNRYPKAKDLIHA